MYTFYSFKRFDLISKAVLQQQKIMLRCYPLEH